MNVHHYHHRGGNGCLWLFLAAFLLGLFDMHPIAGAVVLSAIVIVVIIAVLRKRRHY